MDRSTGEIVYRNIEYSALPSQEKFHLSTARFKGFSGPVGSGKSQALCHEAIRMTYLNRGRTGLIGAPTYPMLRDATLASFTDVLQSNEIPFEYNKAESQLTMKDTGSKILFRAVDDFDRLRGTNLAWFGLDELTYTNEGSWLRLEARLRDPLATRLGGFAVWTPKGFDWVYRRFVQTPVAGYELVVAQPFENKHLLEKVPDYYERLKSSYDQRFYEQEVQGQYLNMTSGAVYSSFDRERIVKSLVLEAGLPLFWTLDFNVDPMCSLIVQRCGDQIRVLDEIVLSRASTLEACEEFFRRFPHHHAGLVVYGDATGSRLQTAGTSDYRIVREFLRQAGYLNVQVKVPAGNPAVRERIQLVNSRLLAAGGGSDIIVSPKCKELIADLEQVTYKPDSMVLDKTSDPRRTHLSDALGYLIWQEFNERVTPGEQPRRLYW